MADAATEQAFARVNELGQELKDLRDGVRYWAEYMERHRSNPRTAGWIADYEIAKFLRELLGEVVGE